MAREPIHPGETLREDLEALGMSAAELARRIEVPVNRITEILKGRRAVTGDTALRLGRFFGTSGEFWLNLQKLYELRRAEGEHGAESRRLPTLAGDSQLSASRLRLARRRNIQRWRQVSQELAGWNDPFPAWIRFGFRHFRHKLRSLDRFVLQESPKIGAQLSIGPFHFDEMLRHPILRCDEVDLPPLLVADVANAKPLPLDILQAMDFLQERTSDQILQFHAVVSDDMPLS